MGAAGWPAAAVLLAHRIHPHAGGVDHAAQPAAEFAPAFSVARAQTAHAAGLVQQPVTASQ
jgi:hypothetical protein